MSKLKNVKALRQMLEGNHRTQTRKTFGFSDAKDTGKIRNVGEIWVEKDAEGNERWWWEQKEGYRVKHHMHPDIAAQMDKLRDYLHSFPNCQKETCTCKQPTNLDYKFKRLVGMCHDCLVTMETRLKIQGKFNKYAIEKMKANAMAFFAEADTEFESLKQSLANVSYVDGADGRVESWRPENLEELLKMLDTQYNSYKEKIFEKLEGSNQ